MQLQFHRMRNKDCNLLNSVVVLLDQLIVKGMRANCLGGNGETRSRTMLVQLFSIFLLSVVTERARLLILLLLGYFLCGEGENCEKWSESTSSKNCSIYLLPKRKCILWVLQLNHLIFITSVGVCGLYSEKSVKGASFHCGLLKETTIHGN